MTEEPPATASSPRVEPHLTPHGQRIVLVAAVAANGVIGVDGAIPWRLPEDLRHFKATTMGHVVLMGRRTYDSIGRPLPGRTNVVLTRDREWSAAGVLVVHSVDEGLVVAQDHEGDVMVIGGGQVYADTMPLATHQVLTEVHQAPDGDAFYPRWDRDGWSETAREPHEGYDFVWWERGGGWRDR